MQQLRKIIYVTMIVVLYFSLVNYNWKDVQPIATHELNNNFVPETDVEVIDTLGLFKILQLTDDNPDNLNTILVVDTINFQINGIPGLFVVYAIRPLNIDAINSSSLMSCVVTINENGQLNLLDYYDLGVIGFYGGFNDCTLLTYLENVPIFWLSFTEIGQGIVAENIFGLVYDNGQLSNTFEIEGFSMNNSGACDTGLGNCFEYTSEIIAYDITASANGIYVVKKGTDFNINMNKILTVCDTVYYEIKK